MCAGGITAGEGSSDGDNVTNGVMETAASGSSAVPAGEGIAADSGGPSRRRGKCKWFNVAKGWGFITAEDGGQDVFVHQSVIQMSGFRSLGDEEEVEFSCKTSDKGLEATAVTGPGGADCHGSHRRPMAKKRFRKIRCYNCGEFANHVAAKCTMGPQPKRCHHCKSESHLIAECTARRERVKRNSEEGEDVGTPKGPSEEANEENHKVPKNSDEGEIVKEELEESETPPSEHNLDPSPTNQSSPEAESS